MSTSRQRIGRRPWFGRWSYPCLLPGTPLLRRGAGEVQIGLDSEQGLVIVGPVPALHPWLSRLDGGHHVSSLRALAAEWSLDDAHLDWILQALEDAGLLVDADARPVDPASSTDRHRIRIVGAGATSHQVAVLLIRSGIAALDLVDPRPMEAEHGDPTGAAATRAEALAARITTETSGDRRTAPQLSVHNHWSKPEGRRVDLTIVAGDSWESDRLVTDGLLRMDQPHLVVRPRGDGVLIGPLVVPGRTACLRCTDLVRTDADPAWPILLSQLTRTRSHVAPAVTAWAAATAVSQVLAHLGGRTPETYGATLEMSGTDFLVRRRAWTAHPGCGCAWSLTAEWAHEQRPG